MDKKRKKTIALYDELNIERSTVHHILERENGFDILYSCSNIAELEEYILNQQPDIFLINAMFRVSKPESCMSKLRKIKKDIQLVFYGCPIGSVQATKIKKAYGQNVHVCPDDWSLLINLLFKITNEEGNQNSFNHKPVNISINSHFLKIASNEDYIRILRFLRDGLQPKQIALRMNKSIHTITSYIKKMHELSGYSSTTKMIIDAHDEHLV